MGRLGYFTGPQGPGFSPYWFYTIPLPPTLPKSSPMHGCMSSQHFFPFPYLLMSLYPSYTLP